MTPDKSVLDEIVTVTQGLVGPRMNFAPVAATPPKSQKARKLHAVIKDIVTRCRKRELNDYDTSLELMRALHTVLPKMLRESLAEMVCRAFVDYEE